MKGKAGDKVISRPDDWTSIRSALKTLCSTNSEDSLIIKLATLQQGEKSIEQFHEEVESTARDLAVYQTEGLDQDHATAKYNEILERARIRFISGINGELSNYLFTQYMPNSASNGSSVIQQQLSTYQEVDISPIIMKLYTTVSNETIDFIIDTASQASYIKFSLVSHLDYLIFTHNVRILTGISNTTGRTEGEITIGLFLDDFNMNFTFQVLKDENTNLSHSGILGRDFQDLIGMIIDWEYHRITAKVNDRFFYFSMPNKLNNIYVEPIN